LLDHTVGEYCKDEGTEHNWEMYSADGNLIVDCRCGARAAQFAAEWALNMGRVPVRVEFPGKFSDTDWVDITPRL